MTILLVECCSSSGFPKWAHNRWYMTASQPGEEQPAVERYRIQCGIEWTREGMESLGRGLGLGGNEEEKERAGGDGWYLAEESKRNGITKWQWMELYYCAVSLAVGGWRGSISTCEEMLNDMAKGIPFVAGRRRTKERNGWALIAMAGNFNLKWMLKKKKKWVAPQNICVFVCRNMSSLQSIFADH